MKKEKTAAGIFLLIVLLSIFAVSVFAVDDQVAKGYTCLENKVKTKCTSLTMEEQAFSLLALSYDSTIQAECKSALISNSNNQECWPGTGCKLKETSVATLALQRIKADTAKSENWLANQTKTPPELTWYLEIDAKEASTCKISYNSGGNSTITLAADKKISGSPGSCLTIAYSGYWLQIKTECLANDFKVTCDKDFVSTLIYQKTGSDIWHISSDTKQSTASGTTDNQVNSLCFKENNQCSYEGSLWAAVALQKTRDVNAYLPYLVALAPDNPKLNPDSFLYILTGSEEYLVDLRSLQNTNGFWDFTSTYGKNYDTALSLFAGANDEQADQARTWLLSVQGTDGCWSGIRDNAFILYAGWPKEPAAGSVTQDNCEPRYFCSSRVECADATGEVFDNYACSSGKVCCSKTIPEKTCAELLGKVCKDDETCSGDLVGDGTCCSGTCEAAPVTPECEVQNKFCRNSCFDGEESTNLACNGDQICCQTASPSKPSYWWVWLLAILIILVALGIIFRKQLRVWLFKIKGGFKSGPAPSQTRPGYPPTTSPNAAPRPVFRPMMPPANRPQMMPRPMSAPVRAKEKSKLDSELEDTLKKLKDMSK